MNLEKTYRALDKKLGGKFGISVEWLATGERWGLRADAQFPTASVIKTQIMVALFERVKKDRVKLSTLVPMRKSDIEDGSGVLKHMSVGTKFTLRDLCVLMIILSDNTATNMVIDYLGLDTINASIQSWGYPNTVLNRKISFDPQKRIPKDLAFTTPAETTDLLARIARREMLGKRYDEEMERILGWQKYDTGLPRMLPGSGDWDDDKPEFVIAHKTGSISGVRNDVGIITCPEGRYAISVFTKKLKDNRGHPDNKGLLGIAQANAATYEAIKHKYGRKKK